MTQRRWKINQNLDKTKCMNCVIIVIVTILALVIYFVNTCLEEKVKTYPKLSTDGFLLEQRNKDKRMKGIKKERYWLNKVSGNDHSLVVTIRITLGTPINLPRLACQNTWKTYVWT